MHILSMVGLNARCMQDDLEKRPTCQAKDLRISSEPYNQVLKAIDPVQTQRQGITMHYVYTASLRLCSTSVASTCGYKAQMGIWMSTGWLTVYTCHCNTLRNQPRLRKGVVEILIDER